MLVLYQGSLGQGKTLGMSIFTWLMSLQAGGIPIFANYGIREEFFNRHRELNSEFKIGYVRDYINMLEMCQAAPALFVVDEQHMNMDSRLFSNTKNIYMTQFFMYLRKLKITMFMTSQNINQIDLRLRNILDVLVDCKKTPNGFYYSFWDFQYLRQLKRLFLPFDAAKCFFDIYNTGKIVSPISFPKDEKAFLGFLSNVEIINERKWQEVQSIE